MHENWITVRKIESYLTFNENFYQTHKTNTQNLYIYHHLTQVQERQLKYNNIWEYSAAAYL
jgi:hypothetical protein